MAVYPYDVNNLPPAPPIQLQPAVKASFSSLGWWLSTIAIGCTILNLSFIPVLVASFPPGKAPTLPPQVVMSMIGFCLGTIGAEPGLLAIFAVFGPAPAWRRQIVAVFLTLLLAIVGAVGIFVTEKVHSIFLFFGPTNWVFILLVPILFCACQSPLWVFRSLFCWRIAKVHQGTSDKAPRLSIAGILAATSVIALALGAVRLGPLLFPYLQPGAIVDVHVWWLLTGIWAAAVSTISLTVLPLFTAAILRTKRPLLGVAGAAIWSALLFEAAISIAKLVNGGGWPFPFSWHAPAALVAGFAVSLFVPLFIVRLYGYRLLWGLDNAS